MNAKQHEAIKRVQVGLVGLALIVGVLAVSGAILARLNPDQGRPPVQTSAHPAEKVNEPMARLGIAPADQASAPQNVAAAPPANTTH